jgi:hypothetical protein
MAGGVPAIVTLRMLGLANARGEAIVKGLARRFGPERVVAGPGDVREALDSLAGDWDEYLVLHER